MDFLIVLIVLMLYLLPAILANMRGHKNFASIFVLNIFLGWTFLGWVIALVWSLSYKGENNG